MGDCFRRWPWVGEVGGRLPEGLMGGARGEQGAGVNQKTVQAQKAHRTAKSPWLGKGLIAGAVCPSDTTTLWDQTPSFPLQEAFSIHPSRSTCSCRGARSPPQENLCLVCGWLLAPGWSPGVLLGRRPLLCERGWQKRLEQEDHTGPCTCAARQARGWV